MLSWLKGDSSRSKNAVVFQSVVQGLQDEYKSKILPMEKSSQFHSFWTTPLVDADFAAKPLVLLLGQYSVGKSTFIRHVLGTDYPGLRIGPEPTTDKFVAVSYGESEKIVPGNALVCDQSLPFQNLSQFGNEFLIRFEGAQVPSKVLEGVTFIDTPGVLSGEKQRIARGYDFEAVIRWFAERVDLIVLLFDAHKLDISDEFRRSILALRGNDIKIRIVLNKADQVSQQQLMRVYGALMWSLGKVLETPEVSRVFLGSFWDEPMRFGEFRELFEKEAEDLYSELAGLPKNAAVRKLNDLIKRARLLRAHAYLLGHLKAQMPTLMGKSKKKQELIGNLNLVYQELASKHGLSMGDFPDVNATRGKLEGFDFKSFSKVDTKVAAGLDSFLNTSVSKLLEQIPLDAARDVQAERSSTSFSPFAVSGDRSVFLTKRPDIESVRVEFDGLAGPSAKIAGARARDFMVEVSKLPNKVLGAIWALSDLDGDGELSLYEFALAKHWMAMKSAGHDLPASVPGLLLPEQ